MEKWLSDRDVRILRLMAEGLSNQEIAEKLSYSPLSLTGKQGFVRSIFNTLEIPRETVNKRTAAVAIAFRQGVID